MKKLLLLPIFLIFFTISASAQDEYDELLTEVIEDMCDCSRVMMQLAFELQKETEINVESKKMKELLEAFEEETRQAEYCIMNLESKYDGLEEKMDEMSKLPDFENRMMQVVKEVCPNLARMMEMTGSF